MYFYKVFKWDAQGGGRLSILFFLTKKKIVLKLKKWSKDFSLTWSLNGILPLWPRGRFLESPSKKLRKHDNRFPHS